VNKPIERHVIMAMKSARFDSMSMITILKRSHIKESKSGVIFIQKMIDEGYLVRNDKKINITEKGLALCQEQN